MASSGGQRRPGGGGDPLAAIPDPRYRSATEKRLCEEVMKREGGWDETTGTFRTKESVLQQRTQLITGMQQTLRVSPQLQYTYQSADKDCVYPQCPATLLRNTRIRAADLGVTDPKPENVERCMTTAMQRRARPVKLPPSRVGTDEALGHLEAALLAEAQATLSRMGGSQATTSVVSDESFFDEPGAAGGGRLRGSASLYAKPAGSAMSVARGSYGGPSPHRGHGGNATPALHSPAMAAGSGAASSFPVPTPPRAPRGGGVDEDGYLADVGAAGPNQYSSLLMELRMTKQTAQERKKKHSALQAILDMDGSADLKRTITRMFADPKNAERISAEEAQRREARFAEDKQAQIRQQTRLLAEERSLMDKELAMLK